MFTSQKTFFVGARCQMQTLCARGLPTSWNVSLPAFCSCKTEHPSSRHCKFAELQWSRGLFRKPLALEAWEAILQLHYEEIFDEHVRIFTDGSASHGESVPLSARAVSLADDSEINAAIVDSGPPPGMQSNYRAGMYAVLVAVRRCALATFYIDHEAVVSGLIRFQTFGWQPSYWQKRMRSVACGLRCGRFGSKRILILGRFNMCSRMENRQKQELSKRPGVFPITI